MKKIQNTNIFRKILGYFNHVCDTRSYSEYFGLPEHLTKYQKCTYCSKCLKLRKIEVVCVDRVIERNYE